MHRRIKKTEEPGGSRKLIEGESFDSKQGVEWFQS